MPVQLASPGVYIQEISSGVRTIAGVATSVAAFLGAAPRGPINKATRIFSFADFERAFGGLAADSEMSYGVRQFFLNGGTDAWIVRVVKDAAPASRTLLSRRHRDPAPDRAGRRHPGQGSGPGRRPGGEFSSVRILAGSGKNAAGVLKLGVASGGVEVDAVAGIRPALMPDPATLTSGAFAATDLDTLPDATHSSLRLSLDGYGPDVVDLGNAAAAGANLAAKLVDMASRLQAAVRALKPGNPAYRDFTTTATATSLVLASGSRGAGSSLAVSAAPANDIAGGLHLLVGATLSAPPTDAFLNGGSETPYGTADIYPAFIGSRSKREGLYALEDADLFNILVLPGITDPGVLADAASYCEERRAFFIVDAPPSATDVAGRWQPPRAPTCRSRTTPRCISPGPRSPTR